MRRSAFGFRAVLTVGVGAIVLATSGAAQTTDPVKCHKEVVKRLANYKKTYLKAVEKCLDQENEGKTPGPCPDAIATFKINKTVLKAEATIPLKCSLTDLTTTLGYRSDCAYEAATTGVEGTCAAKPVTTPAEFADCLLCWKGAELAEFVALLYASHANEVCQSDLSESSPVCSDLNCTTPLPDQRNLTGTTSGGEEFCQKGIARAGVKYLLDREKILEKCALKGGTSATCLAGTFDPTVPLKLETAVTHKDTTIKKLCGNRDPLPSPPFCCRTGTGSSCTVATSRDDCTMNLGGTVQEGKTCSAGSCAPTPGNHKITWWGVCPESDCTGTLSTLQNLIDCVDSSADQIVAELLCLQFRGNGGADWPCPPADGP